MTFPTNNFGNPHPKTIKLERFLVEAREDGKVITYAELAAAIEVRSVRAGNPGYGYLATARRRLLRGHEIHMLTVTGVGIKFPTAQEHLADSASQRGFIRRKARRVAEAARVLDLTKLPEADRAYQLATVGQLNALEWIAGTPRHKKLQEALGNTRILPEPKALLEHFK